MNLRNKYLLGTLRTLLGLFILFSGVSGFMAGPEMNYVPEPMIESSKQLYDMGIFQMIKATEIVAGVMLLINLFPALAIIFLAPILVGAVIYNSMVAPQFVITPMIVGLFEIYFGYAYWDQYKHLFRRGLGVKHS